MNSEKHGPLYFDPYNGRAVAPSLNSEREKRRRFDQAWAERKRMSDAAGWFEDLPPLPEMLRETATLAA